MMALAEIRELMMLGKLTIAGHNHELLEELRHDHRNEDFKIVKKRDDLLGVPGYGGAAMPFAAQRGASSGPRMCRGADFDDFNPTGG